MKTLTLFLLFIRVAIPSEGVTTLTIPTGARASAKAVTVEPEARMIASSGFINVCAALAIACFSMACWEAFSSMLMSVTCGFTGDALPWVRYRTPWLSRILRSFLMVAPVTPNCSAMSRTLMKPFFTSCSFMYLCLSAILIIFQMRLCSCICCEYT